MVFNYLSPDPSENGDASSQFSLPSSSSSTVFVPAFVLAGGISPGGLPVAGRVTEDASLEFPAPPVDASCWSPKDSSDALHLQSHRPQPSSSSNAMNGSPSVSTSTIAGADDRSRLEIVTNAISQPSSLEAPIPSSQQGQATGSRSSPANQNDNVDEPANVDAQKSRAVPTPVNPVLPSPGHSPLPSLMLQRISQTDGEKILGSFVNAGPTLERSAKALYFFYMLFFLNFIFLNFRSVKVLRSKAVSFDTAPPESSSILVVTDDVVKHKWAEFLELSKGGYPLIAANPATTERFKALLGELCGGDIRFSKSPEFRKRCEDFLTKFPGGIDTYRQNRERIAALADLEKDYQHSDDFIERFDQTLKDSRHTLEVLVDEQNDLAAEETKLERQLDALERQLIDVRRRRRLKAAQIIQAARTLESHLDIFDEQYRLNKELAEHRRAKNQLVFDNSCLELDMTIFQKEVRDFVDNM